MKAPRTICGAIALALASAAGAAEPVRIAVGALAAAPSIDGELAEWGTSGWAKIPVAPTVKAEERAGLGLSAEDRNAVGRISVELKLGVAGDRLYLAARWPDDALDEDLDLWVWNGSRYSRSRRYDDMFAVRFDKGGDYDRSMLSGKNYEADVWLWSAGRSNPLGFAEDYHHVISTKMIENAAEYSVKGVGTIYIKKYRDEGKVPFKTVRPPKTRAEERLIAVELQDAPDGSYADVQAKAIWRAGHWSLEMSRRLDTGHADDVAFVRGGTVIGQIAVFNHAADENKSISEPLLFDLSQLK